MTTPPGEPQSVILNPYRVTYTRIHKKKMAKRGTIFIIVRYGDYDASAWIKLGLPDDRKKEIAENMYQSILTFIEQQKNAATP